MTKNINYSIQGFNEYIIELLKNNKKEEIFNKNLVLENLTGDFEKKLIEGTFKYIDKEKSKLNFIENNEIYLLINEMSKFIAGYFVEKGSFKTKDINIKVLKDLYNCKKIKINSKIIYQDTQSILVENKLFCDDHKDSSIFSTISYKINSNKKSYQGGYIKNIINNSDRL